MLNKFFVFTVIISIVGIVIANVSGCAKVPSRLETHYGDSFRQATANQVLNPAAARNLEPSERLDGEAAKIAIDKYRESFKKEEAIPPMMTLYGTQ